MILTFIYTIAQPKNKYFTSTNARAPPDKAFQGLTILKFREDISMEIIEKLKFDMQLCGLSEVTQKNYEYHVRKFASFCEKPLEEVNLDDVRMFLHYLRNNKKLAQVSYKNPITRINTDYYLKIRSLQTRKYHFMFPF